MAVSALLIIVMIIVCIAIMIGAIYTLVYYKSRLPVPPISPHSSTKTTRTLPGSPKLSSSLVSGSRFAVSSCSLSTWRIATQRFGIRATSQWMAVSVFCSLRAPSVWIAMLCIVAAFAVILVPFSIFYYEAEDDPDDKSKKTSQVLAAAKWELLTLIIFFALVFILWAIIGYADIPLDVLRSQMISEGTDTLCTDKKCSGEHGTLVIRVNPIVYMFAMLSLVGWLLFISFGGMGFSALPVDLFMTWQNRPTPLDPTEYSKRKIALSERAAKLIQVGESIMEETKSRNATRPKRRVYNKYKRNIHLLEEDWEKLQLCQRAHQANPILYWVALVVAFLGGIISIMWILHIFLFMLFDPPAGSFLNAMFIAMDGGFPLLGVVFYGIFCFYLLWCVVKGNFKIGMRIAFFSIHPMKIGGTMMNSFLFNVGIILISSIVITHFSSIAFGLYARLTSIDFLFGVQVRYLWFWKWFWVGYQWALVVVALLAIPLTIFLAVRKKKVPTLDDLDA